MLYPCPFGSVTEICRRIAASGCDGETGAASSVVSARGGGLVVAAAVVVSIVAVLFFFRPAKEAAVSDGEAIAAAGGVGGLPMWSFPTGMVVPNGA